MKVLCACSECMIESIDKKDIERLKRMYINEVNDDGIYCIECDKGHKTYNIVDNEKFEILFDMGLDALNKGFRQEAVLSFTTSFERFREWFIRLILTKNDIEKKDFEKVWKYVVKQSERQLGAFYFLYLREFNEMPEEIDQDIIKFRNKVIHNGVIPSYEETYNYGKYIYEYVDKVLRKLEEPCYLNAKLKIKFDREDDLRKKYEIKTERIANQSTASGVYSTGKRDEERETFEKVLKEMKKRNEAMEVIVDESKRVNRKIE